MVFAPHGFQDTIHRFLVGGKKIEEQLVFENAVRRKQVLQQCGRLLKLAEPPAGPELLDVREDCLQSGVLAEQRVNQVHLSAN